MYILYIYIFRNFTLIWFYAYCPRHIPVLSVPLGAMTTGMENLPGFLVQLSQLPTS